MEPWNSLFDLKDRVAIVTGGAMGIGAGIAARLAEQGASVVLADIEADSAAKTLRALPAVGGAKHLFVRTDLRDLAQIDALVDTTVRERGHLDIVVNNAGIFPFAPALSVTPALWDRVLEINLRGPFFLARRAALQMKTQGGGGTMVNIASIDALHPTGSLTPYDASKGGLHMLTRSLAAEFAPLGIRVNAIAPGSIMTPGASQAMPTAPGVDPAKLMEAFLARIPLRRMGEPDDIARATVYLASPASSYVTGVLLVVDGGYLLA